MLLRAIIPAPWKCHSGRTRISTVFKLHTEACEVRNSAFVARMPQVTVDWVHKHYEAMPGLAVPCRSVYDRYLQHCQEEQIKPLSDAYFGRLLHCLFREKGLRWRLFHAGNTHRTYYEGLAPRSCQATDNGKDTGVVVRHSTIATKPLPITVQWLLESFAIETGCVLPCRSVYEQYLQHCKEHQIRPLSDTHFGRLIRSTFQSSKLLRNKHTPGKVRKNYYDSLRRKVDLQLDSAYFSNVAIDLPTDPSLATKSWITHSVSVKQGFAIRCSAVMDSYAVHCKENKIESLGDLHLRRLIISFLGTGVRILRLGTRYRRQYYYDGLTFNSVSPTVEGGSIAPGRWNALRRNPSSRTLGCEAGCLYQLPGDLIEQLNKLSTIEAVHERRRVYRLSFLSETKASLTFAFRGQQFEVRYKIDCKLDGIVAINLKDLCKVLSHTDSRFQAYVYLFMSWRDGLTSEVRDKCFTGEGCNPREPKLSDFLTVYGAGRLLRFAEQYKLELTLNVQQALVQNGIFSPFEKLPVAVPAEVETSTKILASVRQRFADLSFRRSVFVAVQKGFRKKRIMDVWCEQLKLNIECNEHNHRTNTGYKENYSYEREADIRSAKGEDTLFFYYDPHDVKFSSATVAEKLCAVIAKLMESKRAEPANISFDSKLTSISNQAEPIKRLDGNDRVPLCNLSLPGFPSLQQLADVRRSFNRSYKRLTEMHKSNLADQNDDTLRYVVVRRGDNPCYVYFCVDEAVDGLLVFNRESVCGAIAIDGQSGITVFANWRRGCADAKCPFMYVPPVKNSRHIKGPAADTESLSQRGVTSMLEYYESTMPESVSAIRQALYCQFLLSPWLVSV